MIARNDDNDRSSENASTFDRWAIAIIGLGFTLTLIWLALLGYLAHSALHFVWVI
jgi:hypothetical protein